MQVGRVCSESVETLLEHEEVGQQLVRCLADTDLDIAKVAGDVLVTMSKLPYSICLAQSGHSFSIKNS